MTGVATAVVTVAGLAGCAMPAAESAGPQQSPGTVHGSALPASSSPAGSVPGSSGVWKSPIRCPAVADVSAATGIPGLTVAGRNITNAAGEAACVYASANDSGSVLIKHPPIQVGSTPGTLGQFRQALGAVEPVTDAPEYGAGAFLTGSGGTCWLYANFGDGKLIDIQVSLFTANGTTQQACAGVRHTAQLLTR
jgi:hypothetical protein